MIHPLSMCSVAKASTSRAWYVASSARHKSLVMRLSKASAFARSEAATSSAFRVVSSVSSPSHSTSAAQRAKASQRWRASAAESSASLRNSLRISSASSTLRARLALLVRSSTKAPKSSEVSATAASRRASSFATSMAWCCACSRAEASMRAKQCHSTRRWCNNGFWPCRYGTERLPHVSFSSNRRSASSARCSAAKALCSASCARHSANSTRSPLSDRASSLRFQAVKVSKRSSTVSARVLLEAPNAKAWLREASSL
mmetsp:Transcript_49274/g.107617  ORF Transcript_49274/g.107617 Transcript_49274/m.107617 type:complete len:258 (+) Transcript_49274:122-895(+)